ncbi:hypothetical protein L6R46_04230, partial [Myxococcota bacterium]|nr:hypothetical protein [Myxococcota bacterium]
MRYVELICEAAHAAHLNQPGLGVRLSPTSLTAQEARELAAVAPSLLGAEVYVAVAAPGAAPLEEDRVCVAPGERAAERATEWRNLLGPAEWLLYVSAERLGRAGGLHDTLRALPSRALNEAFARSSRNRLPEALIAALREVDLLFTAQARALCAYEEAVGEAPEASRWAVAGERLPILGLAADSGLAHDPVERLRGNLAWVQGASGADPRRASSIDPQRAALAAAIQGAEGEDRASALGCVDLGAVSTQTLSPPKKPRAPRAAPASPAPRAPREASPAPRAAAPVPAVLAASSVAASAPSAPTPSLSASVPSSPPSALAASATSGVVASPLSSPTTSAPPPLMSPAAGIAPAPLPVGPPPPLPWLTGPELSTPTTTPAAPEGLPFTPAPVV